MFASSIATISSTVMLPLLLATAGGILFFMRLRPARAMVPAVLFAALALPGTASAVEVRGGDKVSVAADETIDETVVLVGEEISMQGTINGDLIAFGKVVKVGGKVHGSVYVFGQDVKIAGTVDGNLHVGAQTAAVEGLVNGTGYLFGQLLGLREEGRIDGDLFAFSQAIRLTGDVGRDVVVCGGEKLEVEGGIGRNLSAAGSKIILLDTARVGGDITANVDRKEAVQIAAGASIGGKTITKITKRKSTQRSGGRFISFLLQAAWLTGALLVGLLAFKVFPAIYGRPMHSPGYLLRSVGIGFLALVATPVAAVLVGITLIGLPLSVIAIGFYVLAIYMAKIVVAASIGQALVHSGPGQWGRFAAGLLPGLVIVTLIGYLPVVGKPICFLMLLLGLGAIIAQLYGHRRPVEAI